jgi:hypothetical protein
MLASPQGTVKVKRPPFGAAFFMGKTVFDSDSPRPLANQIIKQKVNARSSGYVLSDLRSWPVLWIYLSFSY